MIELKKEGVKELYQRARNGIGGDELEWDTFRHVWKSIKKDESIKSYFTGRHQDGFRKEDKPNKGTCFIITEERLVYGKSNQKASFLKSIELIEIERFTFERSSNFKNYLVIYTNHFEKIVIECERREAERIFRSIEKRRKDVFPEGSNGLKLEDIVLAKDSLWVTSLIITSSLAVIAFSVISLLNPFSGNNHTPTPALERQATVSTDPHHELICRISFNSSFDRIYGLLEDSGLDFTSGNFYNSNVRDGIQAIIVRPTGGRSNATPRIRLTFEGTRASEPTGGPIRISYSPQDEFVTITALTMVPGERYWDLSSDTFGHFLMETGGEYTPYSSASQLWSSFLNRSGIDC